ncbi:hypothetical protein BDP27DRAFT_1317559 [Rhodocollybia butyracea]|uniref:Nephrocystin 3-like N-terminal domain-containing protein n=1 Tax=Rhodocollybia butyracea TaxID=206335 RepID=A0A9P5Q3Z3_9AGAR|nr:hypothetical protein BDP27DRAFT_1317559 [Rhodocollybia butyracea]
MSFFSDANRFGINGGSFTNYVNHYHVQVDPQDNLDELERSISKGLETLSRKAVLSASHYAEQRFPPPRCHPGTRAHILDTLGDWIRNKSKPTSVYWLYGTAGTGKSAIAQTIAESFSTNGLAASFFFSRTADPSALRHTLSNFFITVAYQLATSPLSSPILNKSITRVAYSRPDITEASLETQFQELIVQPCSQLSPEQLDVLPRLIVIDGLDECVDIASQERLLFISRQAESVQPPLPFEFLICSRPEPRIRNAFKHEQFHSILDCTELGNSIPAGLDIAKYLKDGFSIIRQDHGSTMAHVAQDWPGNHIIQQLVRRACGQFIYAATILKYVGEYHALPTEQLQIILDVTVPEQFDSPYPDLDQLYMLILCSGIDKHNLQLTHSIISHLVLRTLQTINKLDRRGTILLKAQAQGKRKITFSRRERSHLLQANLKSHIQKTLTKYSRGSHSWPMFFEHPGHDIPPSTSVGSCIMLEHLFSLNKGKVGALLFGLHSVLNIPNDDSMSIQMHHASFGEFLTDPKRSGRYFIDPSDEAMAKWHAFCLLRCFSITLNQPSASQLFSCSPNGRTLEINMRKSVEYMTWYEYCSLKIKWPRKSLLVALDQIDTQRFVYDSWKAGGHRPTKQWASAVAFAVQVFWLGKIWRAKLEMAKISELAWKAKVVGDDSIRTYWD